MNVGDGLGWCSRPPVLMLISSTFGGVVGVNVVVGGCVAGRVRSGVVGRLAVLGRPACGWSACGRQLLVGRLWSVGRWWSSCCVVGGRLLCRSGPACGPAAWLGRPKRFGRTGGLGRPAVGPAVGPGGFAGTGRPGRDQDLSGLVPGQTGWAGPGGSPGPSGYPPKNPGARGTGRKRRITGGKLGRTGGKFPPVRGFFGKHRVLAPESNVGLEGY